MNNESVFVPDKSGNIRPADNSIRLSGECITIGTTDKDANNMVIRPKFLLIKQLAKTKDKDRKRMVVKNKKK